MDDFCSRNEMFWGKDFQNYLKQIHIAVFGLGGVGGYALESLCRCGIENFTIIDFDKVSKTNINRQLIALNSTVGIKKTKLFKERLKDINPKINLRVFDDFYEESLNSEIFDRKIDFTIDAIDSLKSKIQLLKYLKQNNLNFITSLGAGNRLNSMQLKIINVKDIKSNDVFVKNVISKLKKEQIELDFDVVVSDEKSFSLEKIKNIESITKKDGSIIELTKYTPASTPFVPAVAGYFMGNYVILKLFEEFKS